MDDSSEARRKSGKQDLAAARDAFIYVENQRTAFNGPPPKHFKQVEPLRVISLQIQSTQSLRHGNHRRKSRANRDPLGIPRESHKTPVTRGTKKKKKNHVSL